MDQRRLLALLAEQQRREKLRVAQLQRPTTLREFIALAWPIVVPNATFIPSFHVDAIADHLTAQSAGQLPRLVVNVPPGSGKSNIVGVFWPAFEWTHNPGCQWQFGSYSEQLAIRDNVRARDLLMTPWYRERWGRMWSPKEVGWLAQRFENDRGGSRQAISVGGAATGFHAHRQVVDDPIKPSDAHHIHALEMVRDWWFQTMASRVLPGDNTRTIIMQRIHDLDLAGIAKENGYEVLSIPMVYEPKVRVFTSIGWTDPRTEPGELMCEARWPQAEVDRRKREFGPDSWAAQDQQDPVPAGGAIYRPEWLSNHYKVLPKLTTARWVISFDCAFKDTDTSDYVCGQVWAYDGAKFYLVDQVHDRMDFITTVTAIKALRAKHHHASTVLVEDKANGSAVISMLSRELPGIVSVQPLGSKQSRAYATQPYFASNSVMLPDPMNAPWVIDFILEHKRFPKAPNDDRVDAQTQALNYLMGEGDIDPWTRTFMASLGAVT
jgi:predicted phage terminase large subunit-like protein